jgi:hypothetical protein
MIASKNYPQGLTRIIFETLVSLTPELAGESGALTPELLQRVEKEAHRRLAPQVDLYGRDRLFFDLIYERSFAEARDLFLETALSTSRPQEPPRPSDSQAVA